MTPKQKEEIVQELQRQYKKVLFCGDGSNDVGALKISDIGVALIGKKDELTSKERKEKEQKIKEEQMKAFKERR